MPEERPKTITRKKVINEIKTEEHGIYRLDSKVKRDVYIKISDEEISDVAKKAGVLYGELLDLETELSNFSEKIKPRIKEKKCELDQLNALMFKGKKKSTSLVAVEKDYENKEVRYFYPDFDGEIVDRRAFVDSDNQMNIGENKK